MSADNYYAIKQIGSSWWCGMGFLSDVVPDELPERCFTWGPYESVDDALCACRNEYAEYGPYVLANAPECRDCAAAYPFGLDTTLPDDQWEMINGSPNGLLCGSCIAKRAANLPGTIAIRAQIEFLDEQ